MTESAERARAEKLAKDLHLTDWDGGDDQGYGGEDVPRPKAVKAIMEFAALAVERERDKAIAWVRKNCQVDTGDGIYGDASKYTAKEIEQAIQRLKSIETEAAPLTPRKDKE